MGSSHTKRNQLIKIQLREPKYKGNAKRRNLKLKKKKKTNRQRQVITVKRVLVEQNRMLKIKNRHFNGHHTYTHTHVHPHLNEGCRTTLIGKMYSKTPFRKRKKTIIKIKERCIDKRILKTKVNIKRQISLSETDSVADLLAVYIAMVAEDIQHRSYCQQPSPHSKTCFFRFCFFFLKHLKWASSFYKRQRTYKSSTWMNIINHEADMLGFQNVTVNLYRLLKTHQTSNMSLEKIKLN